MTGATLLQGQYGFDGRRSTLARSETDFLAGAVLLED